MNKDEFIKNILYWDWKAYKSYHKDLQNKNCECLLLHILNFGINEKRNLCINKNNKNVISDDIIKKHSYLLYLDENNYKDINYEIISINKTLELINDKLWAHLHCVNIDMFDEIYGDSINEIKKYFNVIVTYSEGNNIPSYHFTILKIQNIGMDIGAKICAIKFLNDNNINYDYILMVHSKFNVIKRNQWITPLVNSNNIKIISKLLTLNNNIGLIGTNCRKFNMTYDIDNIKNLKDFLSDFNQSEISLENIDITDGNMYILNSKVSNAFFKYLNKFYNLLYTPHMIQPCWLEVLENKSDILAKFNIPYRKKEEIEKYILEKLIPNGITTKDIYPDAMLEHSIERFILFYTKNICKLDYLMIGDDILKDFNIKFDAIYFPQFHEIPENNKFWGKGFTEWTMLKPFADNVKGKNYDMEIYKPHKDIGYYNLDLSRIKTNVFMWFVYFHIIIFTFYIISKWF